jgi:hypothetical protein
MIGHTPLANPPMRPSGEQAQICLACAQGDHEQVLLTDQCSCPCHGKALDEVAE